jgi:serine protease
MKKLSKMGKKKIWIAIFFICLLLYLWLHFTNPGQDNEATSHKTAAAFDLASNQVLVDLDNDISDAELRALERKYGIKLRPNSAHSIGERLYRSLRARQGQNLKRLIERLRKEPLVEAAEPDMLYGIPPLEREATRFDADGAPKKEKQFPNDPKYKYQWHLDQIRMPKAWPRASGKGVIVAVIDTGVAYRDRGKKFKRVPDLAKTEFVPGYDFVNDHAFPVDDHGHGTHVAGTIAQSTHNGIGVAGVAYKARIMPLKVLSSRGFGSVADIADAVRFAADNKAKVINMSLGASRSSSVLARAVRYAYQKGVVVVCAAGNNGRGQVSFPAAYPESVAVAATQYDRTTTFYSNWGKEIDVAAPGGNTRVDQNGDGMPDGVLQNTIVPGKPARNDYLLFMGTSMASPHVAGVAALVVQKGVTKPDAVERVLKQTAAHPDGKKWDPHFGAGIVDASAAVQKTSVGYGLYTLGFAGLLGLMVAFRLRGRGLLTLRPGLGAPLGVLIGGTGLAFFLPALGLEPPALLTSGVAAWDVSLMGVATPLGHGALVPLLLAVLLWAFRKLRGLIFGVAIGIAGHLLFKLATGTVDIAWIPNMLWLDQLWLGLNALICVGVASLVARK